MRSTPRCRTITLFSCCCARYFKHTAAECLLSDWLSRTPTSAVCITSDNIPSAELECEFRCQWFILLLISRQQLLSAATTLPGQLEDKIGLNEQKLNKPEFSNLNCCMSLQSTDEFSRNGNFNHVYYCKTCVIRL